MIAEDTEEHETDIHSR